MRSQDSSSTAATPPATETVRVADYLVERLQAHDVEHVFGVPGDFVLKLFEHLENGPLAVINTADEQGAGFAADAYARIRGLGVCVVTYGVGGLKVVNNAGQAYAEESPLVIISGAPSLHEQHDQPMLHHKVRHYDTQRRVFDELTVASAVLDEPESACQKIDLVISAAISQKRPVYLEIPRDMTLAEAPRPTSVPTPRIEQSDPQTLAAAITDIRERLAAARRPVAVLGIQVVRFGLLDKALQIIERANLPTTVTLLDKSAVSEQHPLFIGVYSGQMSRPEVTEYVESSDCLFMLGPLLTDVNLGGGTAKLDRENMVHLSRDAVQVGYRRYGGIRIEDVITRLLDADLPTFADLDMPARPATPSTWTPKPDAEITVLRLFERLGTWLRDDTVVLADPGDAMFGAIDLPVRQDHEFLANAFYASLGFAVPASIGAELAAPDRRPLVLVGDGAFQMTGMELSTSIRFNLSPIVVILNNAGYVTERLMIDGAFNDVQKWDYTQLPALFGGGKSFLVETEGDLDDALEAASGIQGTPCILDIRLDPMDVSPALRRLGEAFGAAAGRD
ncbi:MAG: thiamine pyrophosphate-binding protein [Chloroflexota bacterium]|nr:thiamine pyrophosphate-binding protein [Chloroflexota bacterium]